MTDTLHLALPILVGAGLALALFAEILAIASQGRREAAERRPRRP